MSLLLETKANIARFEQVKTRSIAFPNNAVKISKPRTHLGNVVFFNAPNNEVTQAGVTHNGRISIVDLGEKQHNLFFINGVLAKYTIGMVPAAINPPAYWWNEQGELQEKVEFEKVYE